MSYYEDRLQTENYYIVKYLQRLGFKSTIIAGGAIRDGFFRKPLKDIDIFIWDPAYSNERLLSDEIHRVGWIQTVFQIAFDTKGTGLPNDNDPIQSWKHDHFEVISTSAKDHIYENKKNSITSIWKIYDYSTDTAYELIFTKLPPKEHVEKYFDIGLCKCYSDGQTISYTNDFMTDMLNRTLTICGDLTEKTFKYAREVHIPRIKHKYGNFSVIISPELQKYC